MEFNHNINEKLYPVLTNLKEPNAPSDVDNEGHIAGHAYRLQKISEIQ